jgi:hypothetical protein
VCLRDDPPAPCRPRLTRRLRAQVNIVFIASGSAACHRRARTAQLHAA